FDLYIGGGVAEIVPRKIRDNFYIFSASFDAKKSWKHGIFVKEGDNHYVLVPQESAIKLLRIIAEKNNLPITMEVKQYGGIVIDGPKQDIVKFLTDIVNYPQVLEVHYPMQKKMI
ncbi:hypothetical protein, partial [Azospirillum sp. B506]|uniref:hypothetical protein n=1 Tax=Azospirillum sp. B506 TaxID=137721 RepID=UPI00131ED7D5